MIQKEFTGMLPGAIAKFQSLLEAVAGAVVVKGYDGFAAKDSFFYWGAACRITADDMAGLKAVAGAMGIAWLSDDGDMAWTNGLTIDDFQTYRVNGLLELTPEKEDQANG